MNTTWQTLLKAHEPRRPGLVPVERQLRSRPDTGPEIRRLFRLLALHHPETAAHSIRVRRYALWLADEYGLAAPRRRQLGLAARLHDVGKLCVPRAVLDKPARLNPAEFRRVQDHPVAGELLLRGLTSSTAILAAVRWHHERPDGRGYPDGIGGRRLPLLPRLLAVADVFDAMTSPRPYSPPLHWAEALDRLRAGAGAQFDGEVVEAFAAVLRQPALRCEVLGACGRKVS